MELQKILEEAYPTARPGYIHILLKSLETHAKKNNDYNGEKVLFPADKDSLYYDIRRKFGRLYNIMSGTSIKVTEETLVDTALDLGVYSLLLAEELEKYGKDN